MSEHELLQILDESMKWNPGHGITGMLLYIEGRFIHQLEGRFMQVLEGSEQEVRYIFEKIRKDYRHSNLILMVESEIEKRTFHDWTMGFESMELERYKKHPGYFELNENALPLKGDAGNNVPLSFLRSFYKVSKGNT